MERGGQKVQDVLASVVLDQSAKGDLDPTHWTILHLRENIHQKDHGSTWFSRRPVFGFLFVVD